MCCFCISVLFLIHTIRKELKSQYGNTVLANEKTMALKPVLQLTSLTSTVTDCKCSIIALTTLAKVERNFVKSHLFKVYDVIIVTLDNKYQLIH